MSRSRTPWVEGAFAAAFVLALVTPLVVQVVRGDDSDVILQREQRFPTPPPELPSDLESWASFPRRTDAWYSERFGLRNELVHAFQWGKLNLLDESPASHLVIGRDGWLFSDAFQALDCLRGALPMTDDELTAWRESLVAKREWLAARGIDYALVVVPGKGSVYPEMLPDAYTFDGPSRREQLLAEMEKAPEVLVVDLLPSFLEAKRDDRPNDHIYYPLGLHWTPRGALVGYREVMRALPDRHRAVEPLTVDDFEFVRGGRGDDLSHSFLIKGRFEQDEPNLRLAARKGPRREPGRRDDGSCLLPSWSSNPPAPTTALFQRDSFGTAILPNFGLHFREITDCTTLQFSPLVVEDRAPDLYVELWVEHTLGYEVPHVHRVFEQDALRARFDSLPVTLLDPTPAGSSPSLSSLRDTEIEPTPAGARIVVDGVAAARFDPVTWEADGDTILRLDITAPARTYATLFYPLPGLSTYRVKQSTNLPLEAGRQTVFVALPPQRFAGSIALTPGCASGEYLVHDVEIRTTDG